MSRGWRPHRFAPLAQVIGQELLPGTGPAGLARLSGGPGAGEGFQQGMDRGYREGHESGERVGREEGLQRGLAEGRTQGVEDGRRQALEAAKTKFAQVAASVDAIRDKLAALQSDYEAALRKEVVELVGRVARQVVRCELTLQPAQLMSLVDEALHTLPSRPDGPVEVYLNPEDRDRILAIDPARAGQWNLIPDRTLEMGECRIKAGDREVDAGCRGRMAACMEQVSLQILESAENTAAHASAAPAAPGASEASAASVTT